MTGTSQMRYRIDDAIRAVENFTGKRPKILQMNLATRDMFQAELEKSILDGGPKGLKLHNYSGLMIVIDETMLDGRVEIAHQIEKVRVT